MRHNKNSILGLLFALAATALLPAEAIAQPAKLTIAWGFAGDFLPVWVAKEQGFLDRHGLDATLTGLGNSAQAPNILEAGSAQIAFTTPSNLLLAVEGGLDQVAIAGAARLTKANPRTSLVTRPDVSVTKPEDLIGKRVGEPGINSALDINIKKWLLDHNIAADKFTPIEAPFPQMGDLLKSGQIDAAILVEPLLGRVIGSGAGVKSVDIVSENNPDQLGSIWSAKRDWAAANRETVASFRAALDDAIDFIAKNPDAAKEIEAKYLKFSEPTLPTFATQLKPADFAYWIDSAKRLGLLPQPVEAANMVFN